MGRTWVVIWSLAVVYTAGLAVAPVADAAKRPASAGVRTVDHAGALRAGAVKVRVRSRRSGRVRLSVRARIGRSAPVALARSRRVRLRARRSRTVALRLTSSGRRLLTGCAPVRATVTARAGRRKIARGARTLRPDRRRCREGSPGGVNTPMPSGTTVPGAPSPVAGGGRDVGEPLAAPGDWPMWNFDLRGSRHNPHETAITPQSVGKLELKWAFAFPDTDQAQSSQPAVVGDTLYVGARNGRFYALDRRTGMQKWVYDTREVVNPREGRNLLRGGPVVKDGTVYFGDFEGFFYALDAVTGKRRWSTELDTHSRAIITGSPLLHEGRIYIGVSSEEVFAAGSPDYPCCQFRGSLVALDAATGKRVFKHYTVPPFERTGTTDAGTPTFAPNGGAVWNTPSANPADGTVIFGTGPNYFGSPAGDTDSVIAVDAKTGERRWAMQATKGDRWNAACLFAGGRQEGNCPEPGPDYDFGSSPNVFEIGGRRVIGNGQKSGVYHLLDAKTGEPIWRTQLSMAPGTGGAGGQNGIQWGSSYDGQRIYTATNQGVPEPVLAALDPGTGKVLWQTPAPPDGCRTGGAAISEPGACTRAFPAAVSSTPGLVFTGARDGKIRAFDSATGKILWEADTVQQYIGVNGVVGAGGSISHGGPTISHGMLYTNSGYLTSNAPFTGIRGNVLLAYGLPD